MIGRLPNRGLQSRISNNFRLHSLQSSTLLDDLQPWIRSSSSSTSPGPPTLNDPSRIYTHRILTAKLCLAIWSSHFGAKQSLVIYTKPLRSSSSRLPALPVTICNVRSMPRRAEAESDHFHDDHLSCFLISEVKLHWHGWAIAVHVYMTKSCGTRPIYTGWQLVLVVQNGGLDSCSRMIGSHFVTMIWAQILKDAHLLVDCIGCLLECLGFGGNFRLGRAGQYICMWLSVPCTAAGLAN